MLKAKKVRRKEGQLLSVPIDGGFVAGLVLKEPVIAFFDKLYTAPEEITIDALGEPIAFAVMVMNYAVTSGRWRVVGVTNIPDSMRTPPKFCKQDAVSGTLSVYQEIPDLAPNYERPASLDECRGLETAAVWEPEQVEDRLRDYFRGTPNKWVEQLKIT